MRLLAINEIAFGHITPQLSAVARLSKDVQYASNILRLLWSFLWGNTFVDSVWH